MKASFFTEDDEGDPFQDLGFGRQAAKMEETPDLGSPRILLSGIQGRASGAGWALLVPLSCGGAEGLILASERGTRSPSLVAAAV